MKTRYWILIFALIVMICAVLTVCFFSKTSASEQAYVYSDGALTMTLDLKENGEYRVRFGEDWNIITVKDGKVAVTSASCPSQDCVKHGFSDRGAPIVCLPNRLTIEFSSDASYDALIG